MPLRRSLVFHPGRSIADRVSRCGRVDRFRENRSQRTAFTLVELLIGMMITTLVAVVLGGLSYAVSVARQHTQTLIATTQESQAALSRIEYMVGRAATYKLPGEPTRIGLRVVARSWLFYEIPDVLVIWCGGPLAELDPQTVYDRSPRINELLIYTPDPSAPQHLVEWHFPDETSELDFQDSQFESTIRALLERDDGVRTPLCRRLQTAEMAASRFSRDSRFGMLRFRIDHTPTEAAISAAPPGTTAWFELPWIMGSATETTGLRQATLWVELGVNGSKRESGKPPLQTHSFFGAASRRYAYAP